MVKLKESPTQIVAQAHNAHAGLVWGKLIREASKDGLVEVFKKEGAIFERAQHPV